MTYLELIYMWSGVIAIIFGIFISILLGDSQDPSSIPFWITMGIWGFIGFIGITAVDGTWVKTYQRPSTILQSGIIDDKLVIIVDQMDTVIFTNYSDIRKWQDHCPLVFRTYYKKENFGPDMIQNRYEFE